MAKSTATTAPDPDGEGEFFAKLRLTVPGYKLLRALSHGGQGIVYKAIQEKTQKVVAVKVLREGPWADETARQRLEREAKVLAALNHPNIVTMLDSGQTPEGHDFLVMNFIPGLSLDEFYKQNKTPDDPARMLKIFLKICEATNAAHLAGITHRDLSPSNILIDEHDEPHILDFGLARTAFDRFINVGTNEISVTGQFLGKVAYASPEQARGEAVDIRTDVYALGVILYQILTGGAYPYQVVGGIAEVLNNIIHTPPTPPSKLLAGTQAEAMQDRRRLRKRHPPAVNAVIEAIVLKALEKDANQRYQSAGELGRDVDNYLEGKPTVATIETRQPPGKLRRRIRMRTAIAVSGFLMAAIAIFCAWVWMFPAIDARKVVVGPVDNLSSMRMTVVSPPSVGGSGPVQGDRYAHFARGALRAALLACGASDGEFLGPDLSEGQTMDLEALAKAARREGAGRLVVGDIEQLGSEETNFNGYGVSMAGTILSGAVRVRVMDIVQNKMVYSQLFAFRTKPLDRSSFATADENDGASAGIKSALDQICQDKAFSIAIGVVGP